jgi:hypothetical protein
MIGPYLRFRLYALALLYESRIFPNLELCDESLFYSDDGLTDLWRGYYGGELVCIKAIRTRDQTHIREIESVCSSLNFLEVCSVCFLPDLPS